jgi:hypothetical protein
MSLQGIEMKESWGQCLNRFNVKNEEAKRMWLKLIKWKLTKFLSVIIMQLLITARRLQYELQNY